jgi:hypothetical protein
VLDAVAFHEAAHVVVASALGVKLKSAMTVPSTNRTGQIRHRSPLAVMDIDVSAPVPAREPAESAIKICLAGPIAYRRRRPQSWREAYGLGDFETAFDIAVRASGSDQAAPGILEGLLLQTLGLVDGHWGEIEAVAAALMARGTVSAGEVADILRSPAGEPGPSAGLPPPPKGGTPIPSRKAARRRQR